MVGLLIEGVQIAGVPKVVRLGVGERRALVVAEPDCARTLADLVAGLRPWPPGVTITSNGAVRLVPAEGGLLPHLTVLGNMVHASCATHRWSRSVAAEMCEETAKWCGLDDILDRYPYEITPGRRRVAGVARALSANPGVIVLEDAHGLPTWGTLLSHVPNPELRAATLLLIAPDTARAVGFAGAGHA